MARTGTGARVGDRGSCDPARARLRSVVVTRSTSLARSLAIAPLLAIVVLAACAESHERPSDGGHVDGAHFDGGPAECRLAERFEEGDPCALTGTCVVSDGCCETTWRCEEGRLASQRRCGLPGCFTTCSEALASGESGDPCEGAFFCSRFDDALCCERAVECAGGRLIVDDECGRGCATD